MKKHLLSALALLLILTTKAQWQVQNAGFTNDTLGFYEMSLPDKNTAWAVCYDGKRGLFSPRPVLDFTRTVDGGATWIPGKMGTDRTLRFCNISAIDGQEAWVAMHHINFSPGGGVYHTIDGGLTWEQSNPGELFGPNSSVNFVHFKDRNHGMAMGDPNGGYWEIYTTNNKGKKWKRVSAEDIPSPLAGEAGWIGYAAIGNTIWFGTSAGRMYKSTDLGKNWSVYTVDPAGKYVNEIAFNDDALHGVAHLRDNNNRTFLYSTSDGGMTWTNLGQPVNWKSSRITSVPGTNALVATSVNGFDRGSSLSYDNGLTWTVINNTIPMAVARFFDANTGYAGGFFQTGPPFNGGIYKSQIVFQIPPTEHGHSGNENKSKPISSDEKKKENLVKLYPSPATSVITVQLEDRLANTSVALTIVNTDGKALETKKIKGSKSIQLDVSKLSSGNYVLQVDTGTEIITKLFSIVR